ncbi:MAG: dihydropyrimidinase [Rhodospirillaceae bacterium]|nr:dihydropyrimidinase [Rhodospirillaceae bacterium]
MAQQFDLIIRNGTVVTAGDTVRCDIGVKDGRIAVLADALTGAADVVDATGKLVLPGGIDSHVHIDEPPFYGVVHADDFESASISAACGGTTTLIPFVQQETGKALRTSVQEYHKKAEGKAVIDYAFHLIVVDTSEQTVGQELPALVEDGYTSIKIYMTYEGMVLNDYQVLQVLDVARRTGAMVMIHAENDHCIHWLTQKLGATGDTSLAQFPKMAPMAVEREATHRAISLGEIIDVPVLIVHVSAREALEQIKWARDRGLKVYGETCPQYLFLDEELIAQPGWEGAKYLCAPPPRDKSNPDFLWQGIASGSFQVVSSDHCSFLFEGNHGKRANGPHPHFRHVAPGLPGIETRLPLLFSEGVGKNRIDLNTFVAVTATNAAKLYGLYPRKGTIAVGSDADLAIWDPEREVTITRDMLHDRMDFTPYEGFKVKGWPVMTFSRGEAVWRDGRPAGKPGRGRFLPCDRPELAKPLGRAAR